MFTAGLIWNIEDIHVFCSQFIWTQELDHIIWYEMEIYVMAGTPNVLEKWKYGQFKVNRTANVKLKKR